MADSGVLEVAFNPNNTGLVGGVRAKSKPSLSPPIPPASPEAQTTQPEHPKPSQKMIDVVQAVDSAPDIKLGVTDENIEAPQTKINKKDKRTIINQLQKIMIDANAAAARGEKLPPIPEVVHARGEKIIENLRNGDLESQDHAIIYFAITDRMLEMAADVREWPDDRGGVFNAIRRLARRPSHTHLVHQDVGVTSQTAKKAGYREWDQRRVREQIIQLNDLRVNFQRSMFPGGDRDPVFNWIRTGALPPDYDRRTGLRYHDAIVTNLRDLVQTRFKTDPMSLRESDMPSFLGLLIEAHHKAIGEFADAAALGILKDDSLKSYGSAIRDRITAERGGTGPSGGPSLEEQKEKAAEARTSANEAKAARDTLKTKLDAARDALPDLQTKFDAISEEVTQRLPILTRQVANYRDSVTDLEAQVNDLRNKKGEGSQEFKNKNRELLEEKKKLADAEERQQALLQKKTDAERALNKAKQTINDIAGTGGNPGELQKTQEDFDKKETEAKAAEKAVKDAEKVQEKGQDTDAIKALEMWYDVSQNLEKIIAARTPDSQQRQYGGDLSVANLKDTSENDGNLRGADAIRRHVFLSANPAHWDVKAARFALPDEAIARAIIACGNIPTEAGELRDILKRLNSKTPTASDARLLLEKVLPQLTEQSAQKMVLFIAQQGVAGAVQGYSELKIARRYEQTDAIAYLQVDTLLQGDNPGHVRVRLGRGDGIAGPSVRFDGQVEGMVGARGSETGEPNIPLGVHVRIDYHARRTGLVGRDDEGRLRWNGAETPMDLARAGLHRILGNRAAARVTVEYDIDQHFLQALPQVPANGGEGMRGEDIIAAIQQHFGLQGREGERTARDIMRIFYRPATVRGEERERSVVDNQQWNNERGYGNEENAFQGMFVANEITWRTIEVNGAASVRRLATRGGFTWWPPRPGTPARIRIVREVGIDDAGDPLSALHILPGFGTAASQVGGTIDSGTPGGRVTAAMAREVARHFVQNTQREQREYYLSGLEHYIPVSYDNYANVPNGDRINRIIYDNGEFYIQRGNDARSRQVLSEYYLQLAGQTPVGGDIAERQALQLRVQAIQEAIGRQILVALQQR